MPTASPAPPRRTYPRIEWSAWLVGGAILWSGCQPPAAPDVVTAARVVEDDVTPLWDATLSVLERLDMRPERQDRALGLIESAKTTSKQTWEFWREDVQDRYHQALADMQTIQRQATVRFQRSTDPQRWDVIVRVDVYRLVTTERQVTATSAAIRLYSSDAPTATGDRYDVAIDRHWEPLGRDGALESFILNRILTVGGASEIEYAAAG